MKMKRLIVLLSCALAGPLQAQTQFEQLRQIELRHQEEQARARAESERQAAAERKRREALQAQARRQAEAARSAKEQEARRQLERRERLEDEAYALEMEERRLRLEQQRKRVAREDDLIDMQLRERAAQADVMQSKADVNRNLSSGAQTLLEREGEAQVNRSKKWFGQ